MLNPRRICALLLSILIFFTQGVFAYAYESNIWAERRRVVASNQSTPQLASLPSSLLPPPTRQASFSSLSPTKQTWTSPFPQLQSAVDSISPTHATICDVHYSGNPKSGVVTLIQDVHMNIEAQTNIASVLQGLADQQRVASVGVEGSFQPLDFQPFRSFPDQKIVREVTEAFFRDGLLAACSYVGISSSRQPLSFIGVDDKTHYDLNVQAYFVSQTTKDQIKKELNRRTKTLSETKSKIFSPDLLRFDQLRTAYHQEDIGLGVYATELSAISSKLVANGQEITASGFPALDQFLEAYKLESNLDFTQVEKERRTVIEKLTQVLSQKETSELIDQSLAYRLGKLSFGAYYQNLKNLCETKGVHLHQTPAFEKYIRYVLLSDGIKADALFESASRLEQNILEQLAKSPEEKVLSHLTEQLQLTEKLIGFSLTSTEWNRYKELRNAETARNLQSFESFYEEADIRSHAMVENLLKKLGTGKGVIANEVKQSVVQNKVSANILLNNRLLQSQKSFLRNDGFESQHSASRIPQLAALVVGGFHTPLIAELLRQKGISCIVVSPKITRLPSPRTDSGGQAEESYLSVFAQEKTPLDRLFEGEKLFLKPQVGEIDTVTGAKMMASMAARVGDAARLAVARVRFTYRNVALALTVQKGASPAEDTYELQPPRFSLRRCVALLNTGHLFSLNFPIVFLLLASVGGFGGIFEWAQAPWSLIEQFFVGAVGAFIGQASAQIIKNRKLDNRNTFVRTFLFGGAAIALSPLLSPWMAFAVITAFSFYQEKVTKAPSAKPAELISKPSPAISWLTLSKNWRPWLFGLLAVATLYIPLSDFRYAGIIAGLSVLIGAFTRALIGNPDEKATGVWSKQLLNVAIVCLGAGLDAEHIWMQIGLSGILGTVVVVVVTFSVGLLLAKIFKTDWIFSVLFVTGMSICGGSAILAASVALGLQPEKIKEHNRSQSMALAAILVLNTLALWIFPFIAHQFHLAPSQAAYLFAWAIQDTNSVVEAAHLFDERSVELATTLKVMRAACLTLTTFLIAMTAGRLARFLNPHSSSEADPKTSSKSFKLPPLFIFGFILTATLVNLFPALQPLGTDLKKLAKPLLVTAFFLVGSGFKLETFKKILHWRVLAQAILAWLLLVGPVLGYVSFPDAQPLAFTNGTIITYPAFFLALGVAAITLIFLVVSFSVYRAAGSTQFAPASQVEKRSTSVGDIIQLLLNASTEKAYAHVARAFEIFKGIPDSEWQPKAEVLVNLEILTVLLNTASRAPIAEHPLWVQFFLKVAPIRLAFIQHRFPGMIDFVKKDPLAKKALDEAGLSHPSIETSNSLNPEQIAGRILAAPQNGTDIMTAPRVANPDKTSEFVVILKPPTGFNRETIIETVKRIGHFGYQVVGVRVYSGEYFGEHPEIIGSQYMEAWEGYKEGIQKVDEWAEVRKIYDTDLFETTFGTRYSDSMVMPAVQLMERYGLSHENIIALWEKGRETTLFHNKKATGLNKIGSGRSVFPIQDPRIKNGAPVIVVNGYVPSFLQLFQEPTARTVALLVRSREEVQRPMPWEYLRKLLLGNDSNPQANLAGSIRRDAWTGDFPVTPKGNLNGQKNVAHLSSGPLEGMREACIMMGRTIAGTPFGQLLLKAGYPASQILYFMSNPRVTRVNKGSGEHTTNELFRLTEYTDPPQALPVILEYFPPFRESDPEFAPTVTFDEFLEIQRAHQRGELSVRNNRVAAGAIKVSDTKPTYFPEIASEKTQLLMETGIRILRAGQAAVIVPAGGTGGRFGGYALPESHPDRQKVLAKVLAVARGLRSALEIRMAHVLWWLQERGAKIFVLIMGNELNLPAIKQTLSENGNFGLSSEQVDTFQQNGIYRFNPTFADLLGQFAAVSLLNNNGDAGEIFRDDEGHVSMKPAGHVETLVQSVLNRRLLKLARQGVKVLVAANGDDTRFLLDPAKIAYFMENPEQMMVALAWKDVTYAILISGQPYRLVVRGQKIVESNLPIEFGVQIKENQTLEITRDGTVAEMTIESKRVEKGGSLVDLRNGDGAHNPVILEGLAFPEEIDQSQFPYFNTNQLYFKTEAILDLFGLGDLDAYERMPQSELAQRVRETLSKLPFYVEVKDVVVGEKSGKPQTRKAAQMVRLAGDLTRLLKTQYIVIDRDGKEGMGGYGTLKEKQDAAAASAWLEEVSRRQQVFSFHSSPLPFDLTIAFSQPNELGKSESNPTPVVSLTIIDGTTLGPNGEITDKTKILVGVRSDETNITHPGVISTPTQRVPKSVLDDLLLSSRKTEMNADLRLMYPEKILKAFSLQAPVYDSRETNYHNSVIYAVQSILRSKLGLAEVLNTDDLSFTATPVALLKGSVLYPMESPGTEEYVHLARHAAPVEVNGRTYLQEYHEMCSIKVVINNPARVPSSTSSYSELRWIEMGQFVEMATWRSTSHLDHLFPRTIKYCVHGICILSSFAYAVGLGLVPNRERSQTPSLAATVFTGGPSAWLKNLPVRLVFGLAIPVQELLHILLAKMLKVPVEWSIGSLWSSVQIDGRAPPLKRGLVRVGAIFIQLFIGLSLLLPTSLSSSSLSNWSTLLVFFFISQIVLVVLDSLLTIFIPGRADADLRAAIQDFKETWINKRKLASSPNAAAGVVNGLLEQPVSLDISSIGGPNRAELKEVARQVRERREVVLLVDESLLASMEPRLLEALVRQRAENGQSFFIFTNSEQVQRQIEKRLGAVQEIAGRYMVLSNPGLFENQQPGTDRNIILDELVDQLASIRNTAPSNALTDVCLMVPPGYKLKIRRQDYLTLFERWLAQEQLYVIGLDNMLQVALKAMIAA